ncbi:hypothetical protein NDU88_003785 [Pleurodeles waltl]|uniref:Uncharacterized protein n=1 Tax=Pleurodeles waltl TaxID=8319 RepID=A0AAV7UZI2_PLEWA|nr:hypothetical protein NDU88_003785 [Pleurodeles waltl]
MLFSPNPTQFGEQLRAGFTHPSPAAARLSAGLRRGTPGAARRERGDHDARPTPPAAGSSLRRSHEPSHGPRSCPCLERINPRGGLAGRLRQSPRTL